jgi:hypothetical protein
MNALQSCVKQESFCLRDSRFPLAPSALQFVVSPLVLIRQYNFFPDGHNIQKRCENFLKFQSYNNPTIKRSEDAIIIFSKH